MKIKKSRVSEWEKNRNWKINKLCAFRLYLNKVIKLNYFHLLIITQQQQQQQHYSKWAKFLLSLCNIYDVIFFWLRKKAFFLFDIKIDYQWLHLITHMARVDFTIILFVFYLREWRRLASEEDFSSYFFMIIFTHLWWTDRLKNSLGDELLKCCRLRRVNHKRLNFFPFAMSNNFHFLYDILFANHPVYLTKFHLFLLCITTATISSHTIFILKVRFIFEAFTIWVNWRRYFAV